MHAFLYRVLVFLNVFIIFEEFATEPPFLSLKNLKQYNNSLSIPGMDHSVPVSESPDSILNFGIILLKMSILLSERLQSMLEAAGFVL